MEAKTTLEMILAIAKGFCDNCLDADMWLFRYKGKLLCDGCLQHEEALEQEKSECEE